MNAAIKSGTSFNRLAMSLTLLVGVLSASVALAGQASAVTIYPKDGSRTVTCPSGLPGGGGCHQQWKWFTVPGSTGSLKYEEYIRYSSTGGSFIVYDTCMTNQTSRTQEVISRNAANGSSQWILGNNRVYLDANPNVTVCGLGASTTSWLPANGTYAWAGARNSNSTGYYMEWYIGN